jgi:hypothetical protein
VSQTLHLFLANVMFQHSNLPEENVDDGDPCHDIQKSSSSLYSVFVHVHGIWEVRVDMMAQIVPLTKQDDSSKQQIHMSVVSDVASSIANTV